MYKYIHISQENSIYRAMLSLWLNYQFDSHILPNKYIQIPIPHLAICPSFSKANSSWVPRISKQLTNCMQPPATVKEKMFRERRQTHCIWCSTGQTAHHCRRWHERELQKVHQKGNGAERQSSPSGMKNLWWGQLPIHPTGTPQARPLQGLLTALLKAAHSSYPRLTFPNKDPTILPLGLDAFQKPPLPKEPNSLPEQESTRHTPAPSSGFPTQSGTPSLHQDIMFWATVTQQWAPFHASSLVWILPPRKPTLHLQRHPQYQHVTILLPDRQHSSKHHRKQESLKALSRITETTSLQ